jgi:EmrB/QacA subfamily drug resistance transporter
VLLVLCAGVFMLMLDTTIINVAQQEIRTALGTDLTQMQWVFDAYVVTFAVLLLTFGRLGDVFGRRRLFVLGLAVFTAASALCGVTTVLAELLGVSGASLLIAGRVLQGIGGAMLFPQTVALVAVVFPAERRGAAFGLWSAIISQAAVVGPIAGGFIVTYAAWEWIFLINLPLGALVMLFAWRLVPESRDPDATCRLDFGGIVLAGAGIFAFVYALIEANHYGWSDPRIAGSLVFGILLLAALVWWETRASEPILRLELFRRRNFWIGNLAVAAFSFTFFGILLPLSVFLQGVQGRPATEVGLILAPGGLMVGLIAPFGGRLSDKIGSRWLLAAGFATVSLALAMLVLLMQPGVSMTAMLLALTLLGVGAGLTTSQMNVLPMREVPAAVSGSASGILNTTRTVAMALGIAVLATALGHWSSGAAEQQLADTALNPGIRAEAIQLVADGRFEELAILGNTLEQAELRTAGSGLQAAFANGMRGAFLISLGVSVAALGAAFLVRSGRPQVISVPPERDDITRIIDLRAAPSKSGDAVAAGD